MSERLKRQPKPSSGSGLSWVLAILVGVGAWFLVSKRTTSEVSETVATTDGLEMPAAETKVSLPPPSVSEAGQTETNEPLLSAKPVPAQPQRLKPLRLLDTGPAAETSWPSRVNLEGTPEVEIVTEHGLKGLHVYRTKHYEFRCDQPIGADAVRTFSRVFESTYLLNCLLPLDLRPTPELMRSRFVARIFASQREYLAAGGLQGSAGSYSRGEASILVPASSLGVKMVGGRVQMDRSEESGTLIHEITHQVMNAWLPRIPLWLIEGSAEYVEMADYMHGRFYLNQMRDRLVRTLNVGRHRGGAPQFTMLNVGQLMALDSSRWNQEVVATSPLVRQNYHSALVLTYFFYHHDGEGDARGMIQFLRAIENGEPTDQAIATHLLRGRSFAQIETEIQWALERDGVPVTFAERNGPIWVAKGLGPTAR